MQFQDSGEMLLLIAWNTLAATRREYRCCLITTTQQCTAGTQH